MESEKLDFVQYLEQTLSVSEYEKGLRQAFKTPHRRTKVLNREIGAGALTHAELLALAKLLDVAPIELYLDYGVSKETLSTEEVEQLEFVFVTIAPDKEAAIKYLDKSAMAA